MSRQSLPGEILRISTEKSKTKVHECPGGYRDRNPFDQHTSNHGKCCQPPMDKLLRPALSPAGGFMIMGVFHQPSCLFPQRAKCRIPRRDPRPCLRGLGGRSKGEWVAPIIKAHTRKHTCNVIQQQVAHCATNSQRKDMWCSSALQR